MRQSETRSIPGPRVAFWRHQPILDQDPISLAEATIAFHEKIGGDFVKLTPAGTYQAHALGLLDRWDNDLMGRRSIIFRPMAKAKDWLSLGKTDLGKHESYCLQAADWLVSRLPEETPLIATVFSPLSQAIQLAGASTLISHAESAPEAVYQGIWSIARRTMRLIDFYRQVGVQGIYYVSQHHEVNMLPYAALQAWGAETDLFTLQTAEVMTLNIMHFHGGSLIKQLTKLPSGWRVHFEFAPDNPQLNDWFDQRPEPLVVGLPIDALREGVDADFRQITIDQFDKRQVSDRLCFSAACVLPQDFPLDLAANWVRTVKAQ